MLAFFIGVIYRTIEINRHVYYLTIRNFMFRNDLANLNDIVLTIDSVSDTLSFSTFKLFRKAITLLDLDLVRGSFDSGFQYHCTGIFNGYSISLNFYEINNQIKLLHKVYSVQEKDINIEKDGSIRVAGSPTHRENDLPAVIEYSDDGIVYKQSYYKYGKEFRDNGEPVFIATSYDKLNNLDKLYLRYYSSFDYEHENYTLYNISIFNDKVVDADFCYDNELINITKIIEVLPIINTFDLSKLSQLKSILTPDELDLLDMALI